MARAGALLPVDEALRRVLDGAAPLGAESVDLLGAAERVLAADVTAQLTQPPFDASAMDGYAVRAADVARARTAITSTGAPGRAWPLRRSCSAGNAATSGTVSSWLCPT